MRISDWISDVCSSDLREGSARFPEGRRCRALRDRRRWNDRESGDRRAALGFLPRPGAANHFTPFLQRRVEIGIDIVEQRPDPEAGGERRAHADNLLGIGRRPALFGQDSDPATVHAEAVTRPELAEYALELGIL